jgi:hypothetical protein
MKLSSKLETTFVEFYTEIYNNFNKKFKSGGKIEDEKITRGYNVTSVRSCECINMFSVMFKFMLY